MVIVAVHVVTRPEGHVHGPGDTLADFLGRAGCPHLIIYHPFEGAHPTTVVHVDADGQVHRRILRRPSRLPLLIQVWLEWWRTVQIVKSLGHPVDLFIGIDPVNAWAGAWLKRSGDVRRLVFYSADYAIDRFQARWLNAIYHMADRLSARWADVVWNVSCRIVEARRVHGAASKLRLVPNAPSLRAIPKMTATACRYEVISMATTRDTLENELLIKAVAALRREIPEIRLKILGVAPDNQALRQCLDTSHMAETVELLGLRPQVEALRLIQHAAVGVALYTTTQPWTRFGDAKKVREYLACGVPVLMTDVPATADEVAEAGAGLVVPLDLSAITEGLRRLLTDSELYNRCRAAARTLAERWDMDKVLTTELQSLGITVPPP